MSWATRNREQRKAATETPGTIGIVCAEQSRHAAFHQCLAALKKPDDTVVRFEAGGNIAYQRNMLVKLMQGDWLWLIDDDHTFAPDTLMRLLEHLSDERVDAVVPVCLKRFPPFEPVALSFSKDVTRVITAPVNVNCRGLVQIGAAGGGGMLVRRRVFEKLPEPWFTLGQMQGNPVAQGEDLFFCQSMMNAGLQLYCDFDVAIGHIAPVAVWPSRQYGVELQWVYGGGDFGNPGISASASKRWATLTPPPAAEPPVRVVIGQETVGCMDAMTAKMAPFMGASKFR